MATIHQEPAGPPPPPMALHFLHLLEDISAMQELLLAEAEALRARVRELEAQKNDGRSS